jgi:fructose-1,6-bisphosphatase/sedoheptulose 1,7-bisphosphatase-like protein
MASAGECVPVHNEPVAHWIEAPQGTIVVVASYPEMVLRSECRTERMKARVVASLPRICELDFLVHGTNVVRGPMSVQNGELVNGVLTWEEMDSSAVQTC